jgi:L-fucose isomerase
LEIHKLLSVDAAHQTWCVIFTRYTQNLPDLFTKLQYSCQPESSQGLDYSQFSFRIQKILFESAEGSAFRIFKQGKTMVASAVVEKSTRKAVELTENNTGGLRSSLPAIGVFAAGDPRIVPEARERTRNITKMAADILAERVKMPDGTPVRVVYSPVLVDGEKQADLVASMFKEAGVNVLVCTPDTWAFPQLSVISLLQQFPEDTPINFTCGNSGPKPGVVFAHATNGALAQYGRLSHLNVGTWPDEGMNPVMTEATAEAMVDWASAAITTQALKGKRVVIFGHDSMGMETALAHVLNIRKQFGVEITRLDMKLLADMLQKKAYDRNELKEMRAWVDRRLGKRLELRNDEDSRRFDESLALYLIARDIMKDLNAVGGGFMSQLEWGSDKRGIPLPVADAMESFFNASFDHNGKKVPLPFATEADVSGLLTMLFFSSLTGGTAPLFMDFRKVWEPWELEALAAKVGVKLDQAQDWVRKGLVDGCNSGSASFDWAANPGASPEEIMDRVSMPLADEFYFPGMGNSVTFTSPGGLDGIAGRLAFSTLSGLFSLSWDEATTADVPQKLATALGNATTPSWPHTFVVPKYATMYEYKHYPPANHFHMTQGLTPARLEYWMDLNNVVSHNCWSARPQFVEGVDRPVPLLYLLNGGETNAKLKRVKQ